MSKPTLIRTFAFVGLGVATTVLCAFSPKAPLGDTAGVLMDLPDTVGSYSSTELEVSEAEKEILPDDTEFAKKTYTSIELESRLNCSIVLSGQDRNSIHRPEICLPGQGWAIRSSQVRDIELPDGEVLQVMHLGLEREIEMKDGSRRSLQGNYYYWFVGKDITTPTHLKRILVTSFDNIFENLNHRWAYVSVMANVPGSVIEGAKDREATSALMDDFIALSVDKFQTTFETERWWTKLIPVL